ncbi:MAG: hypothetical protein ICV70_06950 [Jiangellaceae bacterium]|nr:hypothetical protein [Jiangellaceae bacterium]
MLRTMRDGAGRPSMRARLTALVALVVLLVVTAPALVPLVRWLASHLW